MRRVRVKKYNNVYLIPERFLCAKNIFLVCGNQVSACGDVN